MPSLPHDTKSSLERTPPFQGLAPFRRGSVLPAMARLAPVSGARIVDAGANKGRTAEALLALYPDATFLAAYEPNARLARKLAKRFVHEPRVSVRQAALGEAAGVASLQVPLRATCASLLSPLDGTCDTEGLVMQETPVVRLEDELDEPPHILKMDVQGFELPVLRGAGRLLAGVTAVAAEVAFRPRYAGQALAWEVRDWLGAAGFVLEGLYGPLYDAEGLIVAADGLFLRRERSGP